MSDSPRIVAGVDGGATRTRAVFALTDGTILGVGTAGPSNYDNVGIPAASAAIGDAVRAARSAAGTGDAPLAGLFLGMAGVVSPEDRETVATMALANALAAPEKIGVDHDIRIALAGGLGGSEGIVLIAGTGSSTYGRRNDGRNHRTGWGYLLDDRGSGYDLGRNAMIAAVMEADGRGPATSLSGIVQERLRYKHIDEILRILYHTGVPVAEVAALAPRVINEAEQGDAVARTILASGAAELARMVETVARALSFSGTPFRLAMVGGLVDHPGLYQDMVRDAIIRAVPGSEIVDPLLPPVLGAVLLAREIAGGGATPGSVERLVAESGKVREVAGTGVRNSAVPGKH
jgi:N-acetylglucosamine kinase-like BadF-type ATPase